MKKHITIFLIVNLSFYISGILINADFDIRNWPTANREILFSFGLALSLLILFGVTLFNTLENKKP